MKKIVSFTISVFLLCVLVNVGFADTNTSKYGGTLRIISTRGPLNIGYAAKQSFVDSINMIWSERLFEIASNGDLLPFLADSYDTSSDGKVITLHLKKGIKFHDNSIWNADACVWTFKTCLSAGVLPDGKYINSIEAVDANTVKITLIQKNSKMIYGLTRMFHYSPSAFEKNGENWAINHSVSTAAFHIFDFQRDVVVKLKKFEDYWQPNRPYLDEIEFKTVKEPATCMVLMQTGQADVWMNVPSMEGADLREKGYNINTSPYFLNNIYCDSASPDSPFANKKVREAVEYAIDRPTVAKALGYGFDIALNQLAPPGSQGYNPNYTGRPYNVEIAKQLLADAGYQSIKTKMLLRAEANALGTIIKNYLSEVGIEVTLDIADPGRYWGSINGGWKGLVLGVSAMNPEYAVVWLDHFGPEPIMRFASMAKSPEYLTLCDQVLQASDIVTMRRLTMDMITQASEDAMAIPLTLSTSIIATQKNVHTSLYKDVDASYWRIFNDWIEK